jgi:thiol-disulfide isomerase/thioredoxin
MRRLPSSDRLKESRRLFLGSGVARRARLKMEFQMSNVYVAARSCGAAIVSVCVLLISCSQGVKHGKITPASMASRADWKACQHKVPEEVCVRCRPELAARFKQRGDWCPEHHIPESQCLLCHPDLDFSPPKEPPAGADVREIVKDGEDLADLTPHVVAGKVTVFDFHAVWCSPCRKVDTYLYSKIAKGENIAIRKINVVSWDTPIAARWLREVPELPFLIVYASNGRAVAKISGAELDALGRAIDEAR